MPTPPRLNPALAHAVDEYTRAHWGIPPDRIYRVNRPHVPTPVIEMGKLRAVHIKPTPKEPIHVIEFEDDDASKLAFDPKAPRRLWLLLSRDVEETLRPLYRTLPVRCDLGELARVVGGRQSRYVYPAVEVAILGEWTHVVYYTEKEGDGPSEYIHRMGEGGGISPYLGVDKEGRLYAAGGTYDVEPRGIVR